MLKTIKLFIALIFVINFMNCANESLPTGGPIDREQPKIISADPENLSTNFNGNKIIIAFDENIQIKNFNQLAIISPKIDGEIKTYAKKNKLNITFEEKLKDSTTYIINFNGAIVDITEGNKLNETNYIFSTTNYLDSNSISGKVYNAFTNKEEKECIIGLYEKIDSTIFKEKPQYLTRSNTNGEFEFKYIKKGLYQIIAFVDNNKNNILDTISEQSAFIKDIMIDDSITNIELKLSLKENKKLKVSSKVINDEYIRIILNKGLIDNEIKTNFNNQNFINKNIIDLYYKEENIIDSMSVILKATDSLNYVIIDTLTFKNYKYKGRKKENKFLMRFIPDEQLYKPNDTIILYFNKPVKNIQEIINKNESYKFIEKENKIIIPTNNEDSILLKDTLFISIYDDTLIYKSLIFNKLNKENTGSIEGIVETNDENFILELIDANNQLIKKFINDKEFKITWLKPGKYKLRYTRDINSNSIWDPMNWHSLTQPEEIIYYKDVITLKADWDIRGLVFKIE